MIETIFLLLFSVFQIISRVFMLQYPQVIFFTIPFLLFISILLTLVSAALFPLSILIAIPALLTAVEAYFGFLDISSRTILLYSTLAGIGSAYIILMKKTAILKKKPNAIGLLLSIGIGILFGWILVRLTTPLLPLYSLPYPILIIVIPIVTAFSEELVFRAIYTDTIWNMTHNWIAIIAPALVAASFAMNFDPQIIAITCMFQIMLCIWYVLTQSFWNTFFLNVAAKLTLSLLFYASLFHFVSPI